MTLPIVYDDEGVPHANGQNNSAYFIARGQKTFLSNFKGEAYRHLVELGEEQPEIFEPVEWNKQKCYVYTKPRKVTLPECHPFVKKVYTFSPRQHYFLKEFGLLRAGLKQACGNKNCYNPYHQTFVHVGTHCTEEAPEVMKTVLHEVKGKHLSAYLRAAKDAGLTAQQICELSPTLFFKITTEQILANPDRYSSPLTNHLMSGLLGQTAQELEPLEVEPPISDALERARQAARDAGNMDAYVMIVNVMEKMRTVRKGKFDGYQN